MRPPLKPTLASWAPSINIIIVIITQFMDYILMSRKLLYFYNQNISGKISGDVMTECA